MDWHSKGIAAAAELLGTSLENGLTQKEAAKRLAQDGPNEPAKQKRPGILKKFSAQLSDSMVLILIAAAVISLITALYNGRGDFSEPLIIIAIVLFNAAVGVIQECKAENAIDALKKSSPRTARAIRGGILTELPARELVRGDIINVSQGDIVPADCRIFDCMGLTVNEASLTGESMPIEKNRKTLAQGTPLAQRQNMLYSGTHTLTGSALAIVTDTGAGTETGRIADMLNDNFERETPLQKRLAHTGKVLGSGAVFICFAIFIMGLFQNRPAPNMLMTAVSLAVAAIPEGLPATVTVMLAIGVRKMARENAVVRRLSAVETLGSADVICTDKTGTLTRNKMSVAKIYGPDKEKLTMYAALCTDLRTVDGELRGDPTETALAEAAGMHESSDMPCVDEIPFSPERRMMTRVFSSRGKYIFITKGAPRTVISRCCFFGGGSLEPSKRADCLAKCTEYESRGLRVLACAYKVLDTPDLQRAERDMELLGLIGLMDEPRPEAARAVKLCKSAGIRPIMITGDSPETAKTIAKAVGIDSPAAVTGDELDKTDKEGLKRLIEGGCNIFARTSPSHKLKIVNTLKEMGHTAAMTGDACNDAPALKAADIGCAMGLCGTEVAREAADIVLSDDNFATIVKAVECGRGIFANIKKAVHFLLSSNMGEIITVFSSMCFCFVPPLAPAQLLWINLVTDSLPAIALGLDPTGGEVMCAAPNRSDKLFDKTMWIRIACEGAMIGLLAMLAGGIGAAVFGDSRAARTMTFAVLSISQLVHAFNMRSEGSILNRHIADNKWLVGAFLAGLFLQTAAICIPALNGIFDTVPLSCAQWGCVCGLCTVPVLVVELEKAAAR
ncbi:MAG: cation-translocating P-type ATPase [Firmicutes bacterium]|nr:cation-translocating P-type ATPase [Bacillota bacterium]